MGCIFGLLSCFWIFLGGLAITLWQVFCVAALFGLGGTAMLIGSLSLTADLIGDNNVRLINFVRLLTKSLMFGCLQLSGAFVFGSMSFFDKLVNGAVIAIIQNFNPLSNAVNSSTIDIRANDSYFAQINDNLVLNSSLTQLIERTTAINNTDFTFDTKPNSKVTEKFYLHILAYVSGAAVIMTFIALLTILKARFARKHKNDGKQNTQKIPE